MNILLVGCGAMGGALKDGWAKAMPNANVTVVTSSTTPQLLPNYDVILFAVKPAVLLKIAKDYRQFVHPNCCFISIAAGISIDQLKEQLGQNAIVIRAMPNLPVTTGCGMTAISGNESLSIAEKLFQAVGSTVCLKESLIDAATAVSGSGPAYFFYLVECLKEAGIAQGLSADAAHLLAHQTLKGAGSMMTQNLDASTLRQKVTSPGGTTAAALGIFQNGLKEMVVDAVGAAVQRAKELRSNS